MSLEKGRRDASTASVRVLHVRAQIADPVPEVRRARARAVRGDAAWKRRLQRYEHGETLIVALTGCALIGDDSDRDRSEPLHFCHEVVWVDRPVAPGALGERLRDLARRNFQAVGPRLRDRGVDLSAGGDAIAVQLEIDPAVERSLTLTPPG